MYILDEECEKVLEEFLNKNEESFVIQNNPAERVVEHLIKHGFLKSKKGVQPFLSGGYVAHVSITQKAKNYKEDKLRHLKQIKRLSRREWRIAITSALIGFLGGVSPYIISLFIK